MRGKWSATSATDWGRKIPWMLAVTLIVFWPTVTWSCDLCGCFTPQVDTMMPSETPVSEGGSLTSSTSVVPWLKGFYAAVAEQFTHFGTLQIDGREVANPTDQHLDSSVTQLVLGYGFNPRLALQLNVPLIYRSFQRPNGFATDHGTESGLGDTAILAHFVLVHIERGGTRSVAFDDSKSPRIEASEPDLSFSIALISGLKMPTGATSRLKEEFHETEIPGAPESGIHGHDLTLGTGSWDGLFGGQMSVRYQRWFAQSDLQFTLRGDGAHQYHFANDLAWSAGPGFYVVRTHEYAIGLQAVISGEHKDVDRFRGKPAEDTGITSVSAGPRVVAAMGRFSAEIEADLPVSIENTSFQAVPDYRIRGGISVRF